MQIQETTLPGILIATPTVYEDPRGYFMESFVLPALEAFTGPITFVQENESKSRYGVTRGLHFQREPYAQSKLLRVVEGEIFDVAVDIRPQSPTYGQYFSIHLSAENKKQLFIPKGFAHGFCTLSPCAILLYKTDNLYHPESEGSFRYDSPDLHIAWPLPSQQMILSPKDTAAPCFSLTTR